MRFRCCATGGCGGICRQHTRCSEASRSIVRRNSGPTGSDLSALHRDERLSRRRRSAPVAHQRAGRFFDEFSAPRMTNCRALADPGAALTSASIRRGPDTWMVLASAYAAPPRVPRRPMLATRALQLVNEVRARGTRCGGAPLLPAPPVICPARWTALPSGMRKTWPCTITSSIRICRGRYAGGPRTCGRLSREAGRREHRVWTADGR